MKAHNVKESYDGTFIEIPTLSTPRDICISSLDAAITKYEAAYGEMPTVVLYSIEDAQFVGKLMKEEQRINHWVPLPFHSDAWAVVGACGIVWIDGG